MCVRMSSSLLRDATRTCNDLSYDGLGLGQSQDGRLGGAPPDYWLAVADAERRQATGSQNPGLS